jgi:TrpR-related protein YerC/YecD
MSWQNKRSEELFRAILSLRTPEEAARFLRDLLTESEIEDLADRWQAVRMLDRGEPYTAIIAATGLSSRTIARIAKWLRSGLGGYRLMLDRQKRAKKG